MSAETRRLAAIMFTDIVGYTALTQQNEALSLELLNEHNRLLRPIFSKYAGREIKTMGDAFHVEFASALDAVRCAIELQETLNEHNASVLPERQLQIRIGIHVGDVVPQGQDIFGDAVNVASRIQPLAEPGGICISAQVYDQVHNKIEAPLRSLGKQELKNVAVPLEVFKLVLPWQNQEMTGAATAASRSRRRKVWTSLGAMATILVVAVALWWFLSPYITTRPPVATSVEESKSIAVLPFLNISKDSNDEYFSDGMTEELINALSHVEGLKVIARTSVFTYKGKPQDVRKIGQELSVRTVLEGSAQKVGEKVRIRAQLINAADGSHLWSETYEREMKDVFAIQDEVAQAIVNTLKVKLTGEQSAIVKAATENPEAHTLYLKGRFFWVQNTEKALRTALEYFNQALEKDPTYALAYTGLADSYNALASLAYVPPDEAIPKAKAAAAKALEIDETLAEAHTSLGRALNIYDYDWVGAEGEFQRAIQLNATYAVAHHWYAALLMAKGRTEESLREIKRAQELDPLSPTINATAGWMFYFARQYDRAIAELQKTLQLYPNYFLAHLFLGWVYEQKGMYKEALDEMQQVHISGVHADMLGPLGQAFILAGRTDEGQRVLNQAKELSKHRYVPSNTIALIYMALGDKDQTFAWLEKGYEEHHHLLRFLKVDPIWDSLRSDPRFIALLKKMGLEK